MDFDLSEEQNLARQAVRDFAEKEIAPVAQELDKKEEFSVDLTRKMAKLGLLGCFVPAAYGGSNMGYISYIIAVEELALTAARCVTLVVTDIAVIEITPPGLLLTEYAPGWTAKDIQALTEPELIVSTDLSEIRLL